MTDPLIDLLICPVHKCPLTAGLYCTACDRKWPSVQGVPVLINESRSVFREADYLAHGGYEGASGYAGQLDQHGGVRQLYRRLISKLAEAAPPTRDFDVRAAIAELRRTQPGARVLVIGAGETAFDEDVIISDVAFGAKVQCIADAHDLPFRDQSFDMCVAVAVLEHVLDPHRCVQEMMRVLRPGGHVYAETPFMQPVHMGRHDFTRYSYLGHRRLFNHFDELRGGVVGGPGSSAAMMLRYAITSLAARPATQRWLRLAALLMTFPLRWLDYPASNKPGAYDSAAGIYFFGRKRDLPIGDRELLSMYRGS